VHARPPRREGARGLELGHPHHHRTATHPPNRALFLQPRCFAPEHANPTVTGRNPPATVANGRRLAWLLTQSTSPHPSLEPKRHHGTATTAPRPPAPHRRHHTVTGAPQSQVHEDQYSGEHYFYKQLRAHPWRVRQPAAALLYVVPLYANAALQPSAKGRACNGTHYQTLFDATARAVAATPQYARHRGADHVIVSNSWKTSQRPPKQAPWLGLANQLPNDYFRHVFRNAIVGHMESRHANDDGWWRCSVVSPYVANFDGAFDGNFDGATAAAQPPPLAPLGGAGSSRPDLFYFHGNANSRGTYGYAFRQVALAQLEPLAASHISALGLPKEAARCDVKGGVTTNCLGARNSVSFRERMARARFNLVLRGDSPSSRRLYDGLAVGTLPVLVSDELWSVGLPFQCLVPWRRFTISVAEQAFHSEAGALETFRRLSALQPSLLGRMQRAAHHHRRDVLWNVNGSRVAENVLLSAALRCLPAFVARSAARRDASLAAALGALRGACVHRDSGLSCRAPDAQNCAGCETGELAGTTPIEHCCGTDSCAHCNRTGRCTPADASRGDPREQVRLVLTLLTLLTKLSYSHHMYYTYSERAVWTARAARVLPAAEGKRPNERPATGALEGARWPTDGPGPPARGPRRGPTAARQARRRLGHRRQRSGQGCGRWPSSRCGLGEARDWRYKPFYIYRTGVKPR
jgi:hypothetical protein